MDSRYNHLEHEEKLYQLWQEHGCFNPDTVNVSAQKNSSFCIVMPPPNANDPLHVGHAMFVSIEDVLTRYHRMLGEDTLWLPGTDHAGIETQFVFEKKLKKEGKSRFNFDRHTLYQMIWDYVQENTNTAVDQLKRLGASADWSRFTFTLDEKVVNQVIQTFQDLHSKGLVYRDQRLINYCTRCGTGFSELEVKHITREAPLYYMKYGPFEIATVRPESKFRDTAVAVNPADPRYQTMIGQTISVDGLLGPITMTVIGDEGVDPEFGTGAMKVTPAHDPHDFELGKKHNLPVLPIIDFTGRMDFSWYLEDPKNTNPKYLERAQKYHGKKVVEARKLMVEDMQEDGILLQTNEKHTQTIGTCYRCGTILEPLPLPQFFIKVKPLAERALQALDQEKTKVLGAGHDKILRHWLENLYDWNISRQIVWGIRLPIWYDISQTPDLHVVFVHKGERIEGTIQHLIKNHSIEDITAGLQELRAPLDAKFVISPTSPGQNFLQETDTFDTWFSSSQWPVVTLRANQPEDFSRFYPTSVMNTGYDILPFWVMRMLFMGLFMTNEVPFHQVYLHGLIRDQKGQKMSKSKGNVINPLDVVERYGADALRLALVIRSSAGLDKSVGDPDFKAARNFTNKIWNAARFITLMIEKEILETDAAKTQGSPNKSAVYGSRDEDFHQRLAEISHAITQQLSDLRPGMAAETAYNEFWHWFCDECIEQAKQGHISLPALLEGLLTFLKLLHPFVPYVTEAIWQELRTIDRVADTTTPFLIVSPWPSPVD